MRVSFTGGKAGKEVDFVLALFDSILTFKISRSLVAGDRAEEQIKMHESTRPNCDKSKMIIS